MSDIHPITWARYNDLEKAGLIDENQIYQIYDTEEDIAQELMLTHKALAFAKSKLNGIHRLYSKAFYTREDWLQVCMEMVDKANTALEQITALEQKDK